MYKPREFANIIIFLLNSGQSAGTHNDDIEIVEVF